MFTEELLARTQQLIDMGKSVLATSYGVGGGHEIVYVAQAPMTGFRSAGLSLIDRIYGREHPHYDLFQKRTNHYFKSDAEVGIAILEVIAGELSGGWLFDIKSLVSAEVFADFLEMAEHLIESGYKDPAAVMIGSVLEEHLRQLCSRHLIAIVEEKDGKFVPLKADRLNADLAKANVYAKLDLKLVTAWLDLRNNAAHGKYDFYTTEQVAQMLAGVTNFMSRVRS